MRILHLIPQLSGGGEERQVSYLAPEMVKAGHSVHVGYLRKGPEDNPMPGVTMHRIPLLGNHDPQVFFKIMRIIFNIKPDIVHSHMRMMDILSGFLCFMTGAVWVMTEPSSVACYTNGNFKDKLREKIARKAAAIFPNSLGGRDYWLQNGFPKEKLFLIPNAIPIEIIESINPLQDNGDSRNKLIYAGRLVPSKNVDILVNAFAKLSRRHNIQLLIAGEGCEKSDLISLVRHLKLEDSVKFLGYLQPCVLWAHIKAAKAFVSLSGFEGTPNVVYEAIACKTPLILSDIKAHKDFLDEESAFLTPTHSVTEVANIIRHVIDHEQEAIQRTTRALRVLRNSSPNLIASEFLNLYKHSLDSAGMHS